MKKLLILGLLVLGLSGCGQSLDTTSHTNDDGDDVTVETNHNRLEDIQDCLEGLRESCMRAFKEGFTGFPLHMEDLKKTTLIQFRDLTFLRHKTGIDSVTYKVSLPKIKLSWYHKVHVYVKLWDDKGAEIWATESIHNQSGTTILSERRLDYSNSSEAYQNAVIKKWQDSAGTFEWSSDTFTKFQVNWSDSEVSNKARILAREE